MSWAGRFVKLSTCMKGKDETEEIQRMRQRLRTGRKALAGKSV